MKANRKPLSADIVSFPVDDGKILSFDLPCFEFYGSHVVPIARVVREGRLRQLSSRHRLFGEGMASGMTNLARMSIH